jgi:predicted phage terminase large subunit-like protein
MAELNPNSEVARFMERRRTATNIDPSEITRLLSNDAWRLSPATFAHRISGGAWQPARHLMWASAQIASAISRGNARLLVAWPPRHGKSELLSVFTPTWFLDQFPDKKVAMISYGADLVEGFAVRVRDLIDEHGSTGLLRCKLRGDRQRVDDFETTAGGHVYAVGLGGTLTGRGAHLMLIDDYLKNAKEAASKTRRDDDYDWFRSVARTRMEPGGSIIILAARWDVDDLAGRLERDAPGRWKIIRMPAIAEENDPLGRQPGEALWEDRVPLEELLSLKDELGSYYWSALYQQKPIRRAQGLTRDKLTIVDVLPHYSRLRLVRFWDLAATEDGGDWTVGGLVAEDILTGVTVIIDIQRYQLSPAHTERLVQETAKADGPSIPIYIEQEPGSAGKTLIHSYKTRVLKGFSVQGLPATKAKFVRAQPFVAQIEAGTVHMLRAPWNQAFMNEIETWPDGDHDDQVDVCASAYNVLNAKNTGGATWGRTENGLLVPKHRIIPAQGDDPTVTKTWREVQEQNLRRGGATFGRETY